MAAMSEWPGVTQGPGPCVPGCQHDTCWGIIELSGKIINLNELGTDIECEALLTQSSYPFKTQKMLDRDPDYYIRRKADPSPANLFI